MGVEWVTYPTLLPRTVSIWVGVVGVKAQAPPNPHDRADHGEGVTYPTPLLRIVSIWVGVVGVGVQAPPQPP